MTFASFSARHRVFWLVVDLFLRSTDPKLISYLRNVMFAREGSRDIHTWPSGPAWRERVNLIDSTNEPVEICLCSCNLHSFGIAAPVNQGIK